MDTLDLTAVSAEQYRASLEALAAAATEMAQEKKWCRAWTRYPLRISNAYQVNGSALTIVIPESGNDPDEWYTPEGLAARDIRRAEQRGQELSEVRGRILWYVHSADLSLENANRLLAAAGLPTYTPEGHRFEVGLPGFTVTRDATREEVEQEFTAFLDTLRAAGAQFENPWLGVYETQGTVAQTAIVPPLRR